MTFLFTLHHKNIFYIKSTNILDCYKCSRDISRGPRADMSSFICQLLRQLQGTDNTWPWLEFLESVAAESSTLENRLFVLFKFIDQDITFFIRSYKTQFLSQDGIGFVFHIKKNNIHLFSIIDKSN